jgi:hypothetical protein
MVPAAVCCESATAEPSTSAGWGASGRVLSALELSAVEPRDFCATAEHFKPGKIDNNASDQKTVRAIHDIKLGTFSVIIILLDVEASGAYHF